MKFEIDTQGDIIEQIIRAELMQQLEYTYSNTFIPFFSTDPEIECVMLAELRSALKRVIQFYSPPGDNGVIDKGEQNV